MGTEVAGVAGGLLAAGKARTWSGDNICSTEEQGKEDGNLFLASEWVGIRLFNLIFQCFNFVQAQRCQINLKMIPAKWRKIQVNYGQSVQLDVSLYDPKTSESK